MYTGCSVTNVEWKLAGKINQIDIKLNVKEPRNWYICEAKGINKEFTQLFHLKQNLEKHKESCPICAY